jgi:vitamin B12 transporter
MEVVLPARIPANEVTAPRKRRRRDVHAPSGKAVRALLLRFIMKTRASFWRQAVLSIGLSAAVPAFAQGTLTRAPTLPDMVVTAARVEQPLSDLVADVSILDREAIERSGALAVPDLLARLPGVEFARNGGPGSSGSVFIRGAESRFTAVYLDGVRVDSQSTGGAVWEQIPLSQIDRIEVLRGPAAAVYGSDALAGVIQLFTRKGEAGFSPYAGAGVGSHGTRRLEAGFSGAQGAIDYSLGLSTERSDGYNSRPVAGQNPDRDGHERDSANVRLGLKLDGGHRIEATLLGSRLESQYDSGMANDDRNFHRLQTGGLTWQARWSDLYSTRVQVSESHSRYVTRPNYYETRTELRNFLFQNEWRTGGHTATAALERREDALHNPATAFVADLRRDRSQDAIALGWGYRAGMHTLQANLRHDDDSEFGGKGTGSLAYGMGFAPGWRATASVGTAFRAPTLYQRFSEYGVATLQPESSRNVELGVRYERDGRQLGVIAYRNRVRDLITFAGAGPCASAFGCYANTARAAYEGVTFTGGLRLGDVNLQASLDLQDPRDLDTGRRLARRAREHAALAADWRVGGWLLGSEVLLSGMRYDNAANTTRLDGYGVVNLSASKALARDWTLQARVDNLGDKDYMLANTYATAGRTFFVSVKWAPQR